MKPYRCGICGFRIPEEREEYHSRECQGIKRTIGNATKGTQRNDLKPVGVKSPLGLLPLEALGAVAAVFEHGAIKYAYWNWMDESQPQARMDELVHATLRHAHSITDPSAGEVDEESGLYHMAHIAATALIWLHKRGASYGPSNYVKDKIQEENSQRGRTEATGGDGFVPEVPPGDVQP